MKIMMNNSFQYEAEAFDLLVKLDDGKISLADVIEWADKKIESNGYDDEIANIALFGQKPSSQLRDQLKKLIRNYPDTHLKYDALKVAKAIISTCDDIKTLDDKANFIQSCGHLSGIVRELGLTQKFPALWMIVDDVEGNPLNNERLRSQWNKDALKRKDGELDTIIEFYRPKVIQECRKFMNEIDL